MIKNPIRINIQSTFADTIPGYTPSRWSSEDLSEDDLIFEAATLEDIELAYMGNEILVVSDEAMFEAITTTRIRLAQTMRAFVRALNRGLNGTNISAGTDEAGADENGRNCIGGAIIGRVRRVANIPVLTAQIPLTDGQSTSIIFHSPTADGAKIKSNDELVAFQFLLNKRNVTHVVAPIGGRDVSLSQVCQALSNLIERNSAKFKKAKERQDKMKADIESYLNEADKLAEERSMMIDRVEVAQRGLTEKRNALAEMQKQLDAQKVLNAELQEKRDKLLSYKKNKAKERTFNDQLRHVKHNLATDGKTTLDNGAVVNYVTLDGDSFVTIAAPEGNFSIDVGDVKGGSLADAATKLLKAYREHNADKYKVDVLPGQPEPTVQSQPELQQDSDPQPASPQDTQHVGKYRYALQSRPAGVGAVPDGNTAVLDRPDQADPYYEYARYGIITYDRKLTDEEVSQYELRYLPDDDELKNMAGELFASSMAKHIDGYVDLFGSDLKTFKAQVKILFRKEFPNVAYPLGDGENLFIMDVYNALQNHSNEATPEPELAPVVEPESHPQTEPEQQPTPEDAGEAATEADQEADKALEYLKSVPVQFTSRDLTVISAELDHVQEAANALISAGRYDENESTVGAAVDYLINILAEIQQGGA